MSNQCRIDVKSMPTGCGFEGGVGGGGSVPSKPLTSQDKHDAR